MSTEPNSPSPAASPSPGEQERPAEALNELVNRIWRETKSVGLGITLPEWKALCACDISKYCASTTAGLTAAAEQHAKEMEQGNTLVNEIENRLSNAEAAQQEAEQALAAEVEAHNFTKIALQHHETARLAASESEKENQRLRNERSKFDAAHNWDEACREIESLEGQLKQSMQATIDTNREMKEEAIQHMNLAEQRCEQWRGIADRLANAINELNLPIPDDGQIYTTSAREREGWSALAAFRSLADSAGAAGVGEKK